MCCKESRGNTTVRWFHYDIWFHTQRKDGAKNLALLTNTPAQAESLQQRKEQTAGGFGLYGNANKTEYMSLIKRNHFHSKWQVSERCCSRGMWKGRQVHISRQQQHLYRKWCQHTPSVDRLLIIWKSDLTNKIKWDFFSCLAVSILLYGCTIWTLTKYKENARW